MAKKGSTKQKADTVETDSQGSAPNGQETTNDVDLKNPGNDVDLKTPGDTEQKELPAPDPKPSEVSKPKVFTKTCAACGKVTVPGGNVGKCPKCDKPFPKKEDGGTVEDKSKKDADAGKVSVFTADQWNAASKLVHGLGKDGAKRLVESIEPLPKK